MTSRINIISMNPSKGDTIHHTTFNSRRIIFVQSIFALIFLIQHQRFFPPSAFALQQPQQFVDDQQLQLTSTTQNYVSRIAGLTARIQCTLNRCAQAPATLAWYKNDVLVFNGTDFDATSGIDPSHVMLQKGVTKSDGNCVTEEYLLLLRNLTLQDSGSYRCMLHNRLEQLDFRLEILESGLKPGFYENYTFDYMACCIERGLSPLCRAMCKPKNMGSEFFDPTSCKMEDYKSFLHCVTDGGQRDYTACCRKRSVPPFCFEFCANNFKGLTRSSRLCLYYMPEFFECYNKQNNVYPPPVPRNVRLNTAQNSFCWNTPNAPIKGGKLTYHISAKLTAPTGGVETEDENKRLAAMLAASAMKLQRQKRRTGESDADVVFLSIQEGDQQQRPKAQIKLDQIEKNGNEICARLDAKIQRRTRYLLSVHSSNDFGASDSTVPIIFATN